MPGGYGRRTYTARPRRPMDWISGEIDSVVTGNSGSISKCGWLCAGQLSDQFTDPTLMAIRVWGGITNLGSSAADHVFGMGIIAWNFTRAPDGSAFVPSECPDLINDPGVCQDEDWIYRWFVPSPGEPAGQVVRVADSEDRMSKARRRLGNDKGLLFVVQSIGPYAYHFHASALIKE